MVLQAAKRAALLELISQLEATNQVPAPTQSLGMCHGRWQLLFSTITITVSGMGHGRKVVQQRAWCPVVAVVQQRVRMQPECCGPKGKKQCAGLGPTGS